jgi:hypothetical protein
MATLGVFCPVLDEGLRRAYEYPRRKKKIHIDERIKRDEDLLVILARSIFEIID